VNVRLKSTAKRTPANPQAPAESKSDIGQRLRAARARIGMTRKQLVQASGASERYLALLETGAGNPSLSVVAALAEALGLAVADLIPLGGERDPRRADLTAAVRRLPDNRLDALEAWLAEHGSLGGVKAGRIVLVGLRGAGKTSLGAALAERLAVPFFEVSKEVEKAYGGSMGVLIEFSGQGALRRHESEVWEQIIASHNRAVIAAPGHIVADGTLYGRVLETARSIWLQATPEDHMTRVVAQGDLRPMESNRSAMADLRAILDARSAEYARADARLQTSAQDFAATTDLLEAEARRLLRTP
jgi:XRE family aerobic/anaerobic benzoate catabolism transcriptional regulator